jgi:Biopterin-dependent aromatic amino acid hydroxylase
MDIRKQCRNMLVLDQKEVPWFPRHISELDNIANRTLDAGTDLEADHPGFNDPVYRARRTELAAIARSYNQGDPIPYIVYTEDEIKTWSQVYVKLQEVQALYACPEYLTNLTLMEKFW